MNPRDSDIGRRLAMSLTSSGDLHYGVSHVGFLKCAVYITHEILDKKQQPQRQCYVRKSKVSLFPQ